MRSVFMSENVEMKEDPTLSDDEESEMLTTRSSREAQAGKRYVWAGTLLLAIVGVVACVVSLMPGAKFHSVPETFGAKTTGLFETDEFKSLIHSQVRSLMEINGVSNGMESDEHIHKHVDKAVTSAVDYIGKQASQSEMDSLRNAHLGPEGWETVRALLKALSDKRVQDVGHAVVQEARANLLAGPAEIGKRVRARLQKEHLLGVAQELLPPKLRSTLLQRWASVDAKEDDIWKMMLDPTGGNLARLRDNTNSTTIESSALLGSTPSRSLRKGPWSGGPKFKLNGAELTLGIVDVVFVSAAEVMLHLDLLLPGVDFPRWVHGMLIVPAFAGGALSCKVGKSFYCEFFLGALGLNALDAVAIAAGLNL